MTTTKDGSQSIREAGINAHLEFVKRKGIHINNAKMGSSGKAEIILFDYMYAPNAQKARNLLEFCGLDYTICEQPFVQPRPILRNLGITYRRVPVNSIGKDVYIDNRIFLDAILTHFANEKGVKDLIRTKHDEGYEAFGYRMFWNILEILPDTVYNDDMIQDRKDLYSMLSKPDFREVRPAAIAAFKQFMDYIEHDFLGDDTKYIMGDRPGLADHHAGWIPAFALYTIDYENGAGAGKEGEGFTKKDYPKVHKWLEAFPKHTPEHEKAKISGDDATEKILKMPYVAPDIEVEDDPTEMKKGDKVQIATTDDTTPGNMPQYGTLVGLNRKEQVIQLENGLRIHFPRIGYSLKRA